MRQMHDLLNNIQIEEDMRELYFQIEREYHKLAEDRGTIIDEITKRKPRTRRRKIENISSNYNKTDKIKYLK
jgi:hypothetical protein